MAHPEGHRSLQRRAIKGALHTQLKRDHGVDLTRLGWRNDKSCTTSMPAHVSRPLIAHVIYCLAQACPRHAAPSVAAGASPPRPLSARSPRSCLRACRMRLPGMSGLMCRVTAPQLPFITELPEVPRAEVRTCLAWSEPGVVTSTMRCGWAGAAPRPPSALETAIVALQATLDMMARWGQSAQAKFRHPRLLAELEALLAERQSGPLPPPARRPAISVHRASTHAVAGAGTCLDNFEAQIAERWADWRRGEVPADEARLSCETCASTSGPAAAPTARARGTRHTLRRRRCCCPQIACPNQEGARRKTPGALRRSPRSVHERLRKLGQSHGGAGGVPPHLPSALPRGCGGSRASAAVVR